MAQDIEGAASGSCHDARVAPDAAFVFAAGDIADIMVAVFDAPMAPDHLLPVACAQATG